MRGQLPRRILMTADTVGGVWVYALELSRALGQLGVEVSLALMGGLMGPAQREEVSGMPDLQVFESEYKLEWMEEPWEDVEKAGRWLLELESAIQPDIVHLNNFAHGALPWQAPNMVVGHSCVYSWWEAVHGETPPPRWERYREAVRSGLSSACAVAAPSGAMLNALKRHYGPMENAAVIFNGRGHELFSPGTKYPFIFSAGRLWDEAKNFGALEEIADELPWPIYVAGENRHPGGKHAAFKKVRVFGRMSPQSLAGWLSRASIYVLPARYEPFGLSVLEAALAGCALVLGNIPSLREIWGESALYVPPDKPDVLRDAIRSLIADIPFMTKMAAFSRKRALELTPQLMARKYLQLYAGLLEGGRGGAGPLKPGELACTDIQV